MLKLSKVNCSRGAPMGRSNAWPAELTDKVHVQRVDLVDGAYDNGGAYWGMGEPLYHAWTTPDEPKNELYVFCRASNREEAKKFIQKHTKNAIFFR